MTSTAFRKTLALGILTGMRSMAGITALAAERDDDGAFTRGVALLAASEMFVDKTPFVGRRIDPIPLAGRAVMGAIVGGVVAHDDDSNVVLGSLIGASVAIAASYAAYHARTRLPLSNAVGGMVEDAVVVALGSAVAQGG